MKISRALSRSATIAYADVFDYPLTPTELAYWSIGVPMGRVAGKTGFVTLAQRRELIHIRAKRWVSSQEKWDRARRVTKWLSYIPTIRLVGVTGALAMNNAKQHDDIDLFFIVSSHTLWISRLLATVVVQLLGVRRKPHAKHIHNTVCLNMFMTENGLGLAEKEQDLFAAHEVLQMQPVFERGGTYQKFLAANAWVKYFLPTAWKDKSKALPLTISQGEYYKHILLFIAVCVLWLLEIPAKKIQLWYMQKNRTTEVITDRVLRFHPYDARVWIRKKLAARLVRFHVPLDNIFLAR